MRTSDHRFRGADWSRLRSTRACGVVETDAIELRVIRVDMWPASHPGNQLHESVCFYTHTHTLFSLSLSLLLVTSYYSFSFSFSFSISLAPSGPVLPSARRFSPAGRLRRWRRSWKTLLVRTVFATPRVPTPWYGGGNLAQSKDLGLLE